jgi:hypothetical protein
MFLALFPLTEKARSDENTVAMGAYSFQILVPNINPE